MAKKKADHKAGENAGNQKQILARACEKIYALNREKAALKAEHIDPITEEIKNIRKTEVMGDADITAKAFKIHHYQPYADARDIELLEDEPESNRLGWGEHRCPNRRRDADPRRLLGGAADARAGRRGGD